jgi:hypothetical protein
MNKYLELLPIVADRGWRSEEGGYIRDIDGRCPLCSLAHELSDGEVNRFEMALNALADLGLPFTDADEVISAADDRADALRPALMAALGMKP